MKYLPVFAATAALLSSCIDPYMNNMGRDPYADPYGQQHRADMRDQGRQMNQMAFERGWQDGQMDAQNRQSQNYNRHRGARFDPNTEMAYRDGYSQGFASISSSLNNLNQRPPAYPPQGGGFQQPKCFSQMENGSGAKSLHLSTRLLERFFHPFRSDKLYKIVHRSGQSLLIFHSILARVTHILTNPGKGFTYFH